MTFQASEGLVGWLAEQGVALAFTTYRANRLLLLGRDTAGALRMRERLFDRPMGLFVEGDSLWMAGRCQIWRLDNHLAPGLLYEGGDRLYVPASCTLTGDVNAHELVVASRGPWAGQVMFVNTAFSCLAGLERGSSFAPRWQPPFLERLAADDACHLNGVALEEGLPTWATACGHHSGPSSWRNDRREGGVVLHLPSDSVVATGLSMPHSPRWHEGRLWVLNSGSGELGWIAEGCFQPLCPLPGFTRGLAFVAGFAVVGLSKLRAPQFTGLALDERLPAEGHPAGCCGLRVIELSSGRVVHSVDLPEPIDELFDVVVLPGVREPLALGLQGEEIECLVRLPDQAELVRVRPLAPSGKPHQGPALPVFGQPEASPFRAAEAPGVAETPVPDPAVVREPIRYQRVFHLNTTNLAPYATLTHPSLAPGSLALERISGELLGVSAMAAGAMVAFAIAERQPDGSAQLLSLKVAPTWRRRGIGTGLLARLMAFLVSEGVGALTVRYRTTPLTEAALEPMLARLGWEAPRTEFVLLEGRAEQLAAAVGWADRHPITPPYSLLPWGRLTPEQLQAASALEARRDLPPPPSDQPQPDPILSLALLHGQAPVGWLLAHRAGDDIARYSSLFVQPAHRGHSRALAMLQEGFCRQQAQALTTARAVIDSRDGPLLRMLRRHFAPHLRVRGETRRSRSPELIARLR